MGEGGVADVVVSLPKHVASLTSTDLSLSAYLAHGLAATDNDTAAAVQ
jgi:hypothetical protein